MAVEINGKQSRPSTKSLRFWLDDLRTEVLFVGKGDKFLWVCPDPECLDTFWYEPGDQVNHDGRCAHYKDIEAGKYAPPPERTTMLR